MDNPNKKLSDEADEKKAAFLAMQIKKRWDEEQERIKKEQNKPNKQTKNKSDKVSDGGIQPEQVATNPNYQQFQPQEAKNQKVNNEEFGGKEQSDKSKPEELPLSNEDAYANQFNMAKEDARIQENMTSQEPDQPETEETQNKEDENNLEKKKKSDIIRWVIIIIKFFIDTINVITFGILGVLLTPISGFLATSLLAREIIKPAKKPKTFMTYFKAAFPLLGAFINKIFPEKNND